MKKYLTVLLLGSILSTAFAQPGMGGPPAGPHFGGNMAKIFGENSAFSANLEMRITGGDAGEMTMPGKLAYLDGKSRFEMDMMQMKGGGMGAEGMAQMKQMGMDKMVRISRPDKKVSCVVFSSMQSYYEEPIRDADATKPESDFKIEVTELGKDTVDGHACVKNKVVITDRDGKAQESTVWNATDLKKFPVKIETADKDAKVVMLFKDVKLSKPDAAQFEAPADFKKYDSMMALMQGEMMKRMGGGQGMPPN